MILDGIKRFDGMQIYATPTFPLPAATGTLPISELANLDHVDLGTCRLANMSISEQKKGDHFIFDRSFRPAKGWKTLPAGGWRVAFPKQSILMVSDCSNNMMLQYLFAQ